MKSVSGKKFTKFMCRTLDIKIIFEDSHHAKINQLSEEPNLDLSPKKFFYVIKVYPINSAKHGKLNLKIMLK